MSVPPFLELPAGVAAATQSARDAAFAVHRTAARGDVRALWVPGFTGSKEDFIAALPLLEERGVDAAAYDQRGQFQTPGDDDPRRYTVEELAADTLALAAALWPEGPRPHLVGHSLGGLVARCAALADPGAFASLTLLASGPSRIPESQQPQLHYLRAVLPDATMAEVWAAKKALEAARGDPQQPPDVEAFLRTRWVAGSGVALREMAGILLDEPDRCGPLAELPLPIAVAYGTNDDVWAPDEQATMSARVGAAAHIRFGEVAHSPAAEAPAASVAALADFWESCMAADSSGNAVTMDFHLESVGDAQAVRHACDAQVADWGLDGVRDDLQIVVSELVANAWHHGGGPKSLRLTARSGRVRVSVRDDSPVAPRTESVGPDVDHGRGIQLVGALSDSWGVDYLPQGKSVWAELVA